MVKACRLEARGQPCHAMCQCRSAEQPAVTLIGQHGAVHCGIVNRRGAQAKPDILTRRFALVAAQPVTRIDGTAFKGAVPQEMVAAFFGDTVSIFGAQLHLVLQLLGRRHIWHRLLMVIAFL